MIRLTQCHSAFLLRLLLLLTVPSITQAEDNPPPYHWHATGIYMVGKRDQVLLLGSPLDPDGVSFGTSIYWILAQYKDKVEEGETYPSEERYWFHFLGSGQELMVSVGDHWMSYDGKIAMMSPSDFAVLSQIIESRFSMGTTPFSIEEAEAYAQQRMQWDIDEDLPPSHRSVANTIESNHPDFIQELRESIHQYEKQIAAQVQDAEKDEYLSNMFGVNDERENNDARVSTALSPNVTDASDTESTRHSLQNTRSAEIAVEDNRAAETHHVSSIPKYNPSSEEKLEVTLTDTVTDESNATWHRDVSDHLPMAMKLALTLMTIGVFFSALKKIRTA